MKIKKLLALLTAISALVGFWQIGAQVSACESPPPGTGTAAGIAHKFNDANGNGVQDEGELDIEGWLFRLYKLDGGLQLVAEGTTDSNGDVAFTDLSPGWYKLWEELPECWSPTLPGGHYWNSGYYIKGQVEAGQQMAVPFGNIYTCNPPPETCIDLEKTGPETAHPGDTINYHFWVHNCGDIILAGGAHVYDHLFGEAAIWDGELEPDEIHEFDMEYTLPGDLCDDVTGNEADQYENIGAVTGHYDDTTVSDDDPSHYFGYTEAAPAIEIEKSTNGVDADTAPGPHVLAGSVVNWEYVVTNTGNVTLANVVVTDNLLGEICAIPSLAAGESQTCAATGTAEADQYENIGAVTGHYGDATVSDDDPSHYFGATPSIEIEKLVSVDNRVTWLYTPPTPSVLVGNDVYFKLVITNTGNVPLTDTVVSDPGHDVSNCTPPAPLPAGDSFECIVGPLAAEEGLHTNTATVNSDYSGDNSEERYEDSAQASYFGANPSIAIEKYISVDNGNTWYDADLPTGPTVLTGSQTIQFRFVISNTGNVPLANTTFSDPGYDAEIAAQCETPPDEMTPGDNFLCEIGTFVAEEGQHTNTATASGEYGGETCSAADDANYLGLLGPAIEIKKDVRVEITGEEGFVEADEEPGPSALVGVGMQVYFRFTIINTGGVPLTNITLSDDYPGFNDEITAECRDRLNELNDPLEGEGLPPGAEFECQIGPFEVEPGQHTDTATASGDYEGEMYSDEDDANYFGIAPAIDVEKLISVDDQATWLESEATPEVLIGADIWFKFVVTNTGNITLTAITLSDDGQDMSTVCTVPDELSPGAGFSCEIGPFAAEEGQHTDTATVAGYYDSPYSPNPYSDSDDSSYIGVGGGGENYHYIYIPLILSTNNMGD